MNRIVLGGMIQWGCMSRHAPYGYRCYEMVVEKTEQQMLPLHCNSNKSSATSTLTSLAQVFVCHMRGSDSLEPPMISRAHQSSSDCCLKKEFVDGSEMLPSSNGDTCSSDNC